MHIGLLNTLTKNKSKRSLSYTVVDQLMKSDAQQIAFCNARMLVPLKPVATKTPGTHFLTG